MIIIDKMSYGRFGNQILFFNNLIQISNICDVPWWCPEWAGNFLFNNHRIGSFEEMRGKPIKICDSSFFKSITNSQLKKISKENNIVIREPCLGELFFRYDDFNLNNMYKFKNHSRESNKKIAALHFRGTDFHEWNPNAVLPFSYYKDSIEYVLSNFKDVSFKMFTDDMFLESFQKTLNYLKDNDDRWATDNSQLFLKLQYLFKIN